MTATSGASKLKSSVNGGGRWSWRDKRELAASQYGALDLVVRPEELHDGSLLDERVQHILEFVDSSDGIEYIQAHMEAEADSALGVLAGAIGI